MGPFVFLVLALISRPESVELIDSTSCVCQALIQSLDDLQASLSVSVDKIMAFHNGCRSIQEADGDATSGVYTIQPHDSGQPFQVYCDMETDGGGWMVFQRRKDGSVKFNLDFDSYSRGFGNLEGEFWLGNDKLHRLTAHGSSQLRVDLTDIDDESRFALYNDFLVSDRIDNYKMTISPYFYGGDAGNSLRYHNNQEFSTKDNDNDASSENCADEYQGAWWYKGCLRSNLNGLYLNGPTEQHGKGVVWQAWKGYDYSLKASEMKMR